MELTFVTSSESKYKEAQIILGEHITRENIDLEEKQTIDIAEIAKEKARLAVKKTGKVCFVEDVGFIFNAWGNLPGPFIKWFLKIGDLNLLNKMLEGFEDKTATTICMIGYCEPEKEPIVFEGRVEGKIVSPRGKHGFGFDSIFQPKGLEKTYAELGDEKHKISHRFRALQELKKFLDTKNSD